MGLDAVRCEWIKKQKHLSCNQGQTCHIFNVFGIEYSMQLTSSHINKIYSKHFVLSLEKGKIIFIYCLVQFQYLLTVSFYDPAKFL